MRLYADVNGLRARQVVGDAVALAAVYVVGRVASRLRAAVSELDVVAGQLDRAGRSVASGAGRGAEAVEQIPAVGEALATPLRTLVGAGGELSAAGARVGDAVATAATWLPLLLVVLVLGSLATRYVPARVRWVREVGEVQRLLGTAGAARLLGLRAAASRPLRVLRREVGDPALAVAEERWEALAAVELRALGLDPRRLAETAR